MKYLENFGGTELRLCLLVPKQHPEPNPANPGSLADLREEIPVPWDKQHLDEGQQLRWVFVRSSNKSLFLGN